MISKVLTISDRGQITIPSDIRKILGTKYISLDIVGTKKSRQIQMTPIKIDRKELKPEFIERVRKSKEHYMRTGISYSLEEVRKKVDMKP